MNRTIYFFFVLLLLFGLSGCLQSFKLDKAYRNIYLAKYAIDFPVSREKLENCKSKNIKECVKLYETAKSGKKLLLTVAPDIALSYTLETIQQHCLLKTNNDKVLCNGAIMSLYYFNKDKQDSIIIESFNKIPPLLQKHIFGKSRFAWFSNRPNVKLWVKYVEDIPEELFVYVDKNDVVKYFNKPADQFADIGITLL